MFVLDPGSVGRDYGEARHVGKAIGEKTGAILLTVEQTKGTNGRWLVGSDWAA